MATRPLSVPRMVVAAYFAICLLSLLAGTARADDCSGPGDCTGPPGNTAAAKAGAAAVAIAAAATAAIATRRVAGGPPDTDCAQLGNGLNDARAKLARVNAALAEADAAVQAALAPSRARRRLQRANEALRLAEQRRANIEASIQSNPANHPEQPRWERLLADAEARVRIAQEAQAEAQQEFDALQPGVDEGDQAAVGLIRESAARLRNQVEAVRAEGSPPGPAIDSLFPPNKSQTLGMARRGFDSVRESASAERARLQREAQRLERAYADCIQRSGQPIPSDGQGAPPPPVAPVDGDGLPLPPRPGPRPSQPSPNQPTPAPTSEQPAEDPDKLRKDTPPERQPLIPQPSRTSCGIASSAMCIATATGKRVSIEDLIAQSQKDPEGGGYEPGQGTHIENILRLLKNNGVEHARLQDHLDLDSLARAVGKEQPAVLVLNNPNSNVQHAVVLDEVRINPDGTRTVVIRDPWPPNHGTRRLMAEAEFNRQFSGTAITTNPPAMTSPGGMSGSLISR